MDLCASGLSQVVSSLVNDTSGPASFGNLVGVIGIAAYGGVDVVSTTVANSLDHGIVVAIPTWLGAQNASVIGSTITGFGQTGISVTGVAGSVVEIGNAAISGYTQVYIGTCEGIYDIEDALTTIDGATISDVDAGIVSLLDPSFGSLNVANSTLSSIDGDGIVVEDGFVPTVTRTRIRDVAGDGISFSCTFTGVVVDTVVRGAGGDGIVVDDVPELGGCTTVSDGTFLEGNLIVGSGGNGISLADASQYFVGQNAVRGSGLDGLLVQATATDVTLEDNVARGNGHDGFQLDTTDVSVTGNVARRNTGYGFRTVGPVAVDGGNVARGNTAGDCSDPSHLPNSSC